MPFSDIDGTVEIRSELAKYLLWTTLGGEGGADRLAFTGRISVGDTLDVSMRRGGSNSLDT